LSLEDFLNLPEPKQQDIFRAALSEFSTYGYDLASTNRIVAQAGISKGVLFKYFASKEGLFLYVVDRSSLSDIHRENVSDFPDIFAYLEHMARMEIQAIVDDPEKRLFFFLANRMIREPSHPVYARALSRYLSSVNHMIDDYCGRMDESLLKDRLSVSDLKKVLHFLLDSIRMTANQNPDRIFQDVEGALHDLRLVFSIARAGIFR